LAAYGLMHPSPTAVGYAAGGSTAVIIACSAAVAGAASMAGATRRCHDFRFVALYTPNSGLGTASR
jgi:hypothetical protein